MLAVIAACVLEPCAYAQVAQQGSKLVGTGAIGHAQQGASVALSADGNTALVSGNADNESADLPGWGDGATWVWTRNGGVWTQQAKLADPSQVGAIPNQGFSAALSADGNTALVGAPENTGSTRVWVRSGSTWSLEATLVGTGITSLYEFQGASVALSADGNTAIVGGIVDDEVTFGSFGVGAAWVFTRTGTVWTQQGGKLVGSGAIGTSGQGISVALSADGNTAMVGGDLDNGGVGAVWVWTRSGGVWTQQGPKLTGTPVAGTGGFGCAVALSSDGNRAIVGGHDSNGGIGAFYPFVRSGGVWTQESFPKFGTDFAGESNQGLWLSLSGDGTAALVGGVADDGTAGAAWIFTRSGTAWTQQGTKIVGSGAVGKAQQGWRVALSTDGLTALVGGPKDDDLDGAAWVFVATKPAITVQPIDQVACSGNPVTFSAVGASWRPMTVKWQVSTDGGTIFDDVPGATATTFSLTAASGLNGNQYRAVFTSSVGTTNSNAVTLTVATAPVVTTNPTNQVVNDGQTVTFTAAASGNPTPVNQWYVSYDGGVSFLPISGATSPTLSFTASTALSGGMYVAAFATGCGATVQTTGATLTVNSTPVKPAVVAQPASLVVCPGEGPALTQLPSSGPETDRHRSDRERPPRSDGRPLGRRQHRSPRGDRRQRRQGSRLGLRSVPAAPGPSRARSSSARAPPRFRASRRCSRRMETRH